MSTIEDELCQHGIVLVCFQVGDDIIENDETILSQLVTIFYSHLLHVLLVNFIDIPRQQVLQSLTFAIALDFFILAPTRAELSACRMAELLLLLKKTCRKEAFLVLKDVPQLIRVVLCNISGHLVKEMPVELLDIELIYDSLVPQPLQYPLRLLFIKL